MSAFVNSLKTGFPKLCGQLFADLKNDEKALLQLHAEQSFFARFNAGRVRQNTDVEQISVRLTLQSAGRTVERSWTVSADAERDLARSLAELSIARKEIAQLPADPFQVAIKNNGTSEQEFRGGFPAPEILIRELTEPARELDMSGLFCGGPIVSANQNSLGQKHWFSTENFFMDYSLYSSHRAAKGLYADAQWSGEKWRRHLAQTRKNLELLSRPVCEVLPGRYRCYLAPAAVAEVVNTLSWGGLSCAAFRQGRSPLRKLASHEAQLSPLFSVRENFALGLRPAFNSIGEVSATQVPLIENGQFRNFLTSARSAQEYGVASNQADSDESPRALEILPGHLPSGEILRTLGTGLYLSNLHYLNWSDLVSARITGMTRYACFWVEGGEIRGPIKDLRFDVSLYEALGKNLKAVTDFQEINPAVSTYESRSLGGEKLPGLMIDDFPFTL